MHDAVVQISRRLALTPFDSYMLNKVRRLKDVRTRDAATGEKAVLR